MSTWKELEAQIEPKLRAWAKEMDEVDAAEAAAEAQFKADFVADGKAIAAEIDADIAAMDAEIDADVAAMHADAPVLARFRTVPSENWSSCCWR